MVGFNITIGKTTVPKTQRYRFVSLNEIVHGMILELPSELERKVLAISAQRPEKRPGDSPDPFFALGQRHNRNQRVTQIGNDVLANLVESGETCR